MRTLSESFRQARRRQQRMRNIMRSSMSYKMKLNASLMVDQREGVKVASKGDMWNTRHDHCLPDLPVMQVSVL